jgi:hypothetical protein
MNILLEYFHEDFSLEHMPLCAKIAGGSIWLRQD